MRMDSHPLLGTRLPKVDCQEKKEEEEEEEVGEIVRRTVMQSLLVTYDSSKINAWRRWNCHVEVGHGRWFYKTFSSTVHHSSQRDRIEMMNEIREESMTGRGMPVGDHKTCRISSDLDLGLASDINREKRDNIETGMENGRANLESISKMLRRIGGIRC